MHHLKLACFVDLVSASAVLAVQSAGGKQFTKGDVFSQRGLVGCGRHGQAWRAERLVRGLRVPFVQGLLFVPTTFASRQTQVCFESI